MLKRETITATPALAALTEEQLTAIETLSQNDENTVIAARIGEIYGAIDKDLLDTAGVEKNGTEKTYDYLKRVVGALKTQAGGGDTLTAENTALKAEKTRLETALAANAGDKEVAKKLTAVIAELEQTKVQFNELKTNSDKEKTDFEKKLFLMRVENELSGATSGISYKKDMPEQTVQYLVKAAMDKLKSGYKHEFIDDGAGGQRLVFLGENGARLNNPENQLNPYTASELFKKEAKMLGIIDEGRKQPGGGTSGGNAGGGGSTSVTDLSGARTRIEATEILSKALMAKGLTKASATYQEEFNKAWTDYKVSELPEK